jgi:hypothetical protein
MAVSKKMHPLLVHTRALAWIGLGMALALDVSGVLAPAGAASGPASLEARVRPLLEGKCFECHSHAADRIRGGLVMDSRSGMLQGGDSGKSAVVVGDPAASPLMDRIRSSEQKHRMPPQGEALSFAQAALLEDWIRQGAPWPEASTGLAKRPRGSITDKDRAWWAFQPLSPVAVPKVRDTGWARNEVDRFVLSMLEARGITPTPEADRAVLIRRMCFDLWGLPPEPADMTTSSTRSCARITTVSKHRSPGSSGTTTCPWPQRRSARTRRRRAGPGLIRPPVCGRKSSHSSHRTRTGRPTTRSPNFRRPSRLSCASPSPSGRRWNGSSGR